MLNIQLGLYKNRSQNPEVGIQNEKEKKRFRISLRERNKQTLE